MTEIAHLPLTADELDRQAAFVGERVHDLAAELFNAGFDPRALFIGLASVWSDIGYRQFGPDQLAAHLQDIIDRLGELSHVSPPPAA